MPFEVLGSALHKFLAGITSIRDEAIIISEDDMIKANVVDAAHVSMGEFSCAGAGSFDTDGGKHALKTKNLMDFVKKFKDKTITLDLVSGKYVVKCGKASKKIPAVIATVAPKPPVLDTKVEALIRTADVKMVASNGSYLEIFGKDGEIFGKSVDDFDGELIMPIGEYTSDESDVSSSYSSDYVLSFLKHLSDSFTIAFGIDYPMIMKKEYDGSTVKYMLAPKVNED